MWRTYFDVNEVKNSILFCQKESTPTKDVGTTVDKTTMPVCSLKSTTSNQVHATLHSDQSSHTSNAMRQRIEKERERRDRMKTGEEDGK